MESGVDVNASTPAAIRRRDILRVKSGRNRAIARNKEMIQRLKRLHYIDHNSGDLRPTLSNSNKFENIKNHTTYYVPHFPPRPSTSLHKIVVFVSQYRCLSRNLDLNSFIKTELSFNDALGVIILFTAAGAG